MNQREAMEHLGVKSTSTWAAYLREGLPRTPRGRGFTYDAAALDAWKADRDGDDDIPQDYKEMFTRARAEKTAAEAQLRELKLAEERGELVRAADVKATWASETVRARGRMLQVPAEVAAACFAAESEREVEEILRAAIRAGLKELADV